MILKNNKVNGQHTMGNDQLKASKYELSSRAGRPWTMADRLSLAGKTIKTFLLLLVCNCLCSCAGCKYSFKDVSIPLEVKTFRVNFLENKARYINPNLSPQLTERLKQKIIGNTRLTQTNDDNAHYDINGYVTDYSVSTTGISGSTASTNRLAVSFHLVFKNTLDDTKSLETDVTSTFDFPSTQSLSQAEAERNEEIVKNIVDAIFNKIFSNW